MFDNRTKCEFRYLVVTSFQRLVSVFSESSSTVPLAPPAEEEEEEEQEVEDEDLPDLTSFSIDNMKQ